MASLGTLLATACLISDDPYQAGFSILRPNDGVSFMFANNVSDSVIMFSFGDWVISNYDGSDNSWVALSARQGKGGVIYGLKADFSQNTTGKSRSALFRLVDSEHPSDGNAVIGFWQYATRGDGSLGNAADVKRITGSDGSSIELSYDVQHRPLSLRMTKDSQTLSDLSLSYNDRDSIMYVNENGIELTSYYSNDYLPAFLHSSTDTLRYSYLYYNYTPIDFRYYFNYEHRRIDAVRNTCVRYKFPQSPVISLLPDSLHCADTLSYFKGTELVRKLGFEYSSLDNRRQSVDVNQLILGVEECDPYLLLSLFRYCRNTSIVSRARGENEEITVQAEVNGNGSVAKLIVKTRDGDVTYTFDY